MMYYRPMQTIIDTPSPLPSMPTRCAGKGRPKGTKRPKGGKGKGMWY